MFSTPTTVGSVLLSQSKHRLKYPIVAFKKLVTCVVIVQVLGRSLKKPPIKVRISRERAEKTTPKRLQTEENIKEAKENHSSSEGRGGAERDCTFDGDSEGTSIESPPNADQSGLLVETIFYLKVHRELIPRK